MAHCNFPEEFPLDCLRKIIEIMRSGNIQNEKWTLVKEIGCVIGTAGSLMEDNDKTDDILLVSSQAADELESFLPQNDALMSSVSWIEILKILLPILISLLEKNPNA